jgi:flagellar motor switch protein FliN
MADADNPLDDDLLKELGLEPLAPPKATVKPKTPVSQVAPQAQVKARPPMPPQPKAASEVDIENIAMPDAQQFDRGVKQLAEDMPVQLVAVLGKRTMTLRELVSVKQGEFIELKKAPQDAIDLVANGKLVARGELVLIEGKLGIQIKQLIG